MTGLKVKLQTPGLLLILAVLALPVQAQDTDPQSGLIMAEGWQQVRSTCTECHSALLITQNAGSRHIWLSRIRWMQDTQGLQQLAPALEASILDYLATHYGPREAGRRAHLPPHLMPDNPYPVAR